MGKSELIAIALGPSGILAFDFSRQINSETYLEFQAYKNGLRLIRENVPGALDKAFGGSHRAIWLLLDLFFNVPGANWTKGIYEPTLRTLSFLQDIEELTLVSEQPAQWTYAL